MINISLEDSVPDCLITLKREITAANFLVKLKLFLNKYSSTKQVF